MAISDIRKGALDIGAAIADIPLKGKRGRVRFEQKLFFEREALKKQEAREGRSMENALELFKDKEEISRLFAQEDRERDVKKALMADERNESVEYFNFFQINPESPNTNLFLDYFRKREEVFLSEDEDKIAMFLSLEDDDGGVFAQAQKERSKIRRAQIKREQDVFDEELRILKLKGKEVKLTPSQVKKASEKRARESLTKIDFDGTKRTIKWIKAQLVKEESFGTGSELGKRLIRIISKFDEYFDLGSPDGNKGFQKYLDAPDTETGGGSGTDVGNALDFIRQINKPTRQN